RQDRGSGRLALMEVNGRFWGSMALSCHAGLEFPLYAWQVAQGIAPNPKLTYPDGVRFRWLLGDGSRLIEVAELASRRKMSATQLARELVSFLRDFFPPTKDALWSWVDPQPGLGEAEELLRVLVGSATRAAVRFLLPGQRVDP